MPSNISENLSRLHDQIAAACRRANRPLSEVALMAVSKMNPAEAILEAHAAGQHLFGENRVQEFAEKSAAVASLESIEVHLIGPLQSNKTTPAAQLFHSIDTVDSLKIAQRLNSAAAALNKKLPILIEVKLSHEDSKHGLPPEDLPTFLNQIAELSNLTATGLMTVPPWCGPEDPEPARPYFQRLRRLRDEQQKIHPTLTQLSIGMSNDFTVAIEEGSTCIRIGTAIFGKRNYPTPTS